LKEGEASGEDFVVVEELSPEDAKALEVWKEKHHAWRHGEAVVKQQVAATIPNSLFMKVQGKGTTYEIWQALTKDFQNKSRMISMDLRRRLQQQHCAEKGNVRAHFATLRTMHEDLSSMEHPPTDDDFYAILLGSLPSGYEPFISALNTMSSVLGMYLSSDDLMQTLSDEYDCRNISKTSKREENSAFHAGESSRKGKTLLKCFNCQKKGHKKADCWAEGGGKAGQGLRGRGKGDGKDDGKGKGKESAASATGDMAWMAMLDDSDDSDCESLTSSFGPCPSLDELLDGVLDDNFDNVSVADSCPDLQQMISDDFR